MITKSVWYCNKSILTIFDWIRSFIRVFCVSITNVSELVIVLHEILLFILSIITRRKMDVFKKERLTDLKTMGIFYACHVLAESRLLWFSASLLSVTFSQRALKVVRGTNFNCMEFIHLWERTCLSKKLSDHNYIPPLDYICLLVSKRSIFISFYFIVYD